MYLHPILNSIEKCLADDIYGIKLKQNIALMRNLIKMYLIELEHQICLLPIGITMQRIYFLDSKDAFTLDWKTSTFLCDFRILFAQKKAVNYKFRLSRRCGTISEVEDLGLVLSLENI